MLEFYQTFISSYTTISLLCFFIDLYFPKYIIDRKIDSNQILIDYKCIFPEVCKNLGKVLPLCLALDFLYFFNVDECGMICLLYQSFINIVLGMLLSYASIKYIKIDYTFINIDMSNIDKLDKCCNGSFAFKTILKDIRELYKDYFIPYLISPIVFGFSKGSINIMICFITSLYQLNDCDLNLRLVVSDLYNNYIKNTDLGKDIQKFYNHYTSDDLKLKINKYFETGYKIFRDKEYNQENNNNFSYIAKNLIPSVKNYMNKNLPTILEENNDEEMTNSFSGSNIFRNTTNLSELDENNDYNNYNDEDNLKKNQ